VRRSDATDGLDVREQLADADANLAETPAPAERHAHAHAGPKRVAHLVFVATMVMLAAVGFFIFRTTRQGPIIARQTPRSLVRGVGVAPVRSAHRTLLARAATIVEALHEADTEL
jgi:hypothetical protein